MNLQSFLDKYENLNVKITSTVSYSLREEIEKNRQFLHGKFKNPEDTSGLTKFFYNIGFILLNSLYNPTDIDTKDINIRALTLTNRFLVDLIKNVVRTELRFSHFGDKVNRVRWNMLKDGTAVVKLTKDGFELVDLLNLVFLPHEHDWKKQVIAERINLPTHELESKIGKGFRVRGIVKSVVKKLEEEGTFYATIYEFWKKKNGVPTCELWLDTSVLEPDDDKSPTNWSPYIQIDEFESSFKNKAGEPILPYKKVDFITVEGRALGFGVFELIRGLQEHFNELWNIKRKKDRQDLAGTYVYKRGMNESSLTQEFITDREIGAVIELGQDEDLYKLVSEKWTSDIIASADKLFEYARMIVGANAIGVGENLPSSMPATTSAIMAKQNKTTYDVIIEQLSLFLSDLFQDYYLERILDNVSKKEWTLITGNPMELKEIDRYFAQQYVYRQLENMKGTPAMFELLSSPDEQAEKELIERLIQEKLAEIQTSPNSRYVQIKKEMLKNLEFICEVYIANDTFDRNVQIQNILAIASNPLYQGSRQKLFEIILDLLDLGGKDLELTSQELNTNNASQTPQQARPTTGEIQTGIPTNAGTSQAGIPTEAS